MCREPQVLTELPRFLWVCEAVPSSLMAQHIMEAGANIPADTTFTSSSFISPSLTSFFLGRISLWDLSILWDLDLDPQMLFFHDYPLALNLLFYIPLQNPTGQTRSSSNLASFCLSPCSICPCWAHSPATPPALFPLQTSKTAHTDLQQSLATTAGLLRALENTS